MRGFGATDLNQMRSNDQVYVAKNEFTYCESIASALNSGGTTTVTFNIAGDSDFFWTKFAAYAQVASDGQADSTRVIPGVTVVITNTTTGRQYSDNPVPLAVIAGTGELPYILPMETYWAAKTTIQIDLANVTDNTNYSQLYLAFHGIKAFRGG